MKVRTFKGGAHVPHYKKFTEKEPIRIMTAPQKVIIPLLQHMGVPCRPIVEAGDHVEAGQKIGESQEYVSAPVHASISGTVVAIEEKICSGCDIAKRVIIEADEEQKEFDKTQKRDYSKMTKEELVECIKEAGIVGMGGASFPTHVNINVSKPIDNLILNGAECEPFLTCDHLQMREKADELIEGAKIIMNIIGAKKCLMGIEINKQDAIDVIAEKIKGLPEFEIVPLAVKYPQGFKSLLIKTITGRDVYRGARSADLGCIVRNVGTTIAVYEAVAYGKPLIERVVTVSGPNVPKAGNYMIKIGTPIGHVIKECGVDIDNLNNQRIILGGPMTGTAQGSLDAPIIKNSTGVLVLPPEMVREPSPMANCIRCGKCIEKCPMRLYPIKLNEFSAAKKYEKMEEWNVEDCMECGICVFSCPSNRPILEYILMGKAEIKCMKARKKREEKAFAKA